MLRVTFDVMWARGDAQSAVAGSIEAEERSSRDRVLAAAAVVASQLPAESGIIELCVFYVEVGYG